MSLTKRDIARQINAELPAVSVSEAVDLVDIVVDAIKESLGRKEKVMITNFGTFETVQRAARKGINPATGERLVIPSHCAVTFRPSPALQGAMDE